MMQNPDTFILFFFKAALIQGRGFVCLGAIQVFNVCN